MIKLTGGQRIDLLGIRKEDLPKVWADLDMPSGFAYGKSMRTVKTCVGQEFCRFGTGDSTRLGIEFEGWLQGMESPAKMKLAVSGCPRNCAESLVKDVGIVAIEGGRWEIYIGGAAGAHVRKGDLLATVDSPDEAKTLTGRFLQYYRENAKWLERTYAFVPRIGLETIRAIVVDDAEGIAGRLDAAVQQHADSYLDPWLEGRQPAEPGQFRTALAAHRVAESGDPADDRNHTVAAHDLGPLARSRPARAAPTRWPAASSPSSTCAAGRARGGCGLPPQGRTPRRRPDRRPGGDLPACT